MSIWRVIIAARIPLLESLTSFLGSCITAGQRSNGNAARLEGAIGGALNQASKSSDACSKTSHALEPPYGIEP